MIDPTEVVRERARLAIDDPDGERDALAPLEPIHALIAAGILPRGLPGARLERVGPSYRVTVADAVFFFREVRVDRDLSADVTVVYRGVHLFRTGSTLGLTGRDKLAKTAAEISKSDPGMPWRTATFAAVEAVLAAEERMGAPVDLRTADTGTGFVHVLRPLQPNGPSVVVMPGEGGKSTMARALAVSIATGREVIPGIVPAVTGPVLYIAAEDPVAEWHARSVEAIVRGLGISRGTLDHPIELQKTGGRPLHRLARSVAEQAADHALVILDSLQALLPTAESFGNIRDRDGLLWNAVDAIDRPVLILAHPNRADSQRWNEADGRVAGSEVNRDRSRIAWRGVWQDEKAVAGTSFRRYTLTNVKNNHGPRYAPIDFAASWEFGQSEDDPGTVRFMESEAVNQAPKLSVPLADALREYRAGNVSPASISEALEIPLNTAKSRLRLLKGRGEITGSPGDV
jgi:hypothetical protein